MLMLLFPESKTCLKVQEHHQIQDSHVSLAKRFVSIFYWLAHIPLVAHVSEMSFMLFHVKPKRTKSKAVLGLDTQQNMTS